MALKMKRKNVPKLLGFKLNIMSVNKKAIQKNGYGNITTSGHKNYVLVKI